MLIYRIVYIISFSALLYSCKDQDTNSVLFTLLPPDSTGINFANNLHHTPEFNMYTYRNFYNGGGVGMGDINNDGLEDLFFCGNLVDNKLYLNLGNLKFEDITEAAGVASKNIWSTGVSFADVNGDGFLDIYVCKSGKPGGEKRHNELFINNGDLTFTEDAKEYGIADEGFSSHAAFFDYDQDGDLDVYLLNNSFRSVGGYDMRPGLRDIRDTLGGNKLYKNNLIENKGVPVVFTDVSAEAGIFGSRIGFGLGVTIGDVDRDGWQDIYVSNDFFERDYLYINQRDGTFKEDLVNQINEISMGSMGADMADINNDGWPDIFVTEMLPATDARYKTKMTFENWDKYQLSVRNGYHHQFTRNTLQLNNGNHTFSEIGRLSGVHATDWSWSALIADLDNDTYKDIYVSNGIYKDLLDQDYINFYSNDPAIIEGIKNKNPEAVLQLIEKIPSEPISNFGFKNHKDLTFSDETKEWGLAHKSYSNGSIYGDLDNDGDLDLIVNNIGQPAFIFRNNTQQDSSRFIQFSFGGEKLNSKAIGTQVSIFVDSVEMYQELAPMRGFQSCTSHRLTFGLGHHQWLDSVIIDWPGNKKSVLRKVKSNQHLVLNIGDAVPTHRSIAMDSPLPFQRVDPLLEYKHQENTFVDFNRDHLLFHMLSREGPASCTGDVNGNGFTDIFIGGASGQPGSLFIQHSDGRFEELAQPDFIRDRLSEDVEAAFFDIDGDSDLDLIVISGTNEHKKGTPWQKDRIYFNNGEGQFLVDTLAFADPLFESSGCLAVGDFDGDSDPDMFIGNRMLPGVYGVPVNGYLWRNDGAGHFHNATEEVAPGLMQLGMMTDAVWVDLDTNGHLDLIIVGEWMSPKIFLNNGKTLYDATDASGLADLKGLYQSILAEDLDNDGDVDLILGNHGLNTRLKASHDEPLTMYTNDFDQNGTAEQIITMYNAGTAYPLMLRHDLVEQLPSLKKKYLYHENYKQQTINDIFDEKLVRTSAKGIVSTTATLVAWNDGSGKFNSERLPMAAQLSPTMAIVSIDANGDSYTDLLLGGNFMHSKPELGTYNASYGTVLLGAKNHVFVPLPTSQSGIKMEGEIRELQKMLSNGKTMIIALRNNDIPQWYLPSLKTNTN